MKNSKPLLLIIILLINIGCNPPKEGSSKQAKNAQRGSDKHGINTQKVEEEEKAISMLREFYAAYSMNDLRLEDFPEIDSLLKKYVTPQLREETNKYLQDGHDLMTDDWGISDEMLSTMKISMDSTKENTYIVSYIIDSYPVAPDKPIKKQVVLQVTVLKEGEDYKIESVNSF